MKKAGKAKAEIESKRQNREISEDSSTPCMPGIAKATKTK